jgi:hypothetical protein
MLLLSLLVVPAGTSGGCTGCNDDSSCCCSKLPSALPHVLQLSLCPAAADLATCKWPCVVLLLLKGRAVALQVCACKYDMHKQLN